MRKTIQNLTKSGMFCRVVGMQSTKKLIQILKEYSNENNYIVTVNSLLIAFPELSEANINQLLCRANKFGILERVCKGVYLNSTVKYDPSSVLFTVAKILRFSECMYVSLETVLSGMSVISQQMLSCVTIITSGRSGMIECSKFGKIEFVHSDRIALLPEKVKYDVLTGMFWATEEKALEDMKSHRRKLLGMVENRK